MATPFTNMLNGQEPARFVWRDEHAAAILSATPIKPGHCILFSREEVATWLDLPPDHLAALMNTAQRVGGVIQSVFQPRRVAMAIIGIVIPHVHIHLVPVNEVTELDFSRQDAHASPEALDAAAEAIRKALGS